MSRVVAKRKLKKSYYDKNKKMQDINIDDLSSLENNNINGIYRRNGAKQKTKQKVKTSVNDTESFVDRLKKRYVLKFTIQSITTLAIVMFVLLVKYLDIQIVKKAEISQNIIKEFKTNYSKEELVENVENFIDKSYLFVEPIIPDNLSRNAIAVFNNVFNNQYSNTNNVDIYNENKVDIYGESGKVSDKKTDELYEDTVVTVSNSVLEDDENVIKILKTGIEFVKPTVGVITSNFGDREKIFEEDEDFHYGTDIANDIGTPIYSSIDGEVTVCSFNKYTGNYIEVENGSVTTRYCHLSLQLVKVGEKVKKGDVIGKMGDTGYVTGPHLHFEIMYERTRVDATKLLDLT